VFLFSYDQRSCTYHTNSGCLNIDLIPYIKECESLGAGEILLTSVALDGSEQGYDLALIALVSQAVSIPVICNGGAGKPQHCVDAILSGADAVAAASIFHFTQYTPNNIKEAMYAEGLPVRMQSPIYG
jgi:imidazole glycerol-phosphate synthase subunit HisF